MAEQFDQLRALRQPATHPHRVLPGPGPFTEPVVAPADGRRYPWGTAGTAFDHRVRCPFGSSDPRRFVAANGALLPAS